MADHLITKKKPSKVVISAFKKRICTNDTEVTRSDIIVEPRKTQVNPIFKFISAFEKRNCTNNTGVNIRDVIIEPSNTPANPGLGVISAFKKRNFTHNTGVNRRDILVEPSNTQPNPSVDVISISAFKKSNCTNNTVDNLNSTAQEYSIQNDEQSLESAHQDTCHRVWSGATNNTNNVSDSNCNKEPNVIHFTKEQCRVCLKKGSIPIYGHKSNEYLADTIMTIGGVEISTIDNYPKYLCRHCLKLLLNAVMFRNLAQMSDQQFRKLTEKEEPEKFTNKAMSEDDTFSDDDISSDNEEPDVLENHLIGHTGLIDQLSKLLKNPTETRSESKHLNTNKYRDDFSNINKGNPLQKHQYHNTTKILQNPSAPKKLINIVMPKHSHYNLNDNTLNEHLDQSTTEFLLKYSNNEHEKINDGDCSSGTGNTSQELNQIITKILQKLPQTKLEQAKIINIIMPREDYSSCNDNGNTLQQNNKENITEILQKKPEMKSERSKIINIIMPKDYHYVHRINEILKKSSVTISGHTNDDSNDNNMTNTLQENIHNNITDIIDKSVETEPETANLKHNKMPPDDYFGDIAKRISDRERNYRKLEPISVICDECGLLCSSYKEYANHYIDKHPERKKLQCTICQKDYNASYFARHMACHSQGAYVCDICGAHFLDVANFKVHHRTHTTELPFKCSLCAYRGRYARSVKLHMMSHTGERPHKCPQCPKRFINSGNLKRHILKHRGERPFKCETCKRGYFTKGDVKKHKINVHYGKNKHNVCRFCGMYFNTNRNWSRHEREVHKRPKFHHRLPLYVKFDMILKQRT